MRRASRLAGALASAVLLFVAGDTRADSATVPFGLQTELFSKVAEYDKTLPRADGVVRILVLTRPGNAESASAAAHVRSTLTSLSRVAGLPHEDSTAEFVDAAGVASMCRSQSLAILYLTPGLGDVADSIAKALTGIPVLAVSAVPTDVGKGIVLGFDLAGGKPKLLVNLAASRNQGVQLSADVLKIATVIP